MIYDPRKTQINCHYCFFSSLQHCHFSAFSLSNSGKWGDHTRQKKKASNMLQHKNLALLKTTKKKNWCKGNSTKITLAVKSYYNIQRPFENRVNIIWWALHITFQLNHSNSVEQKSKNKIPKLMTSITGKKLIVGHSTREGRITK